MYKVTGEVLNVFHTPSTEKYPESWKVQLMGDSLLKDGQVKKEMLTLNVPHDVFSKLKEKLGQQIQLPVGFFVSGNRLTPFYPKNTK